MIILNENNSAWSEKVNFVDENNVFLGYDMAQDCCEHADWFIADKPSETTLEQTDKNPDLTGWFFDKDYRKHVDGGNFDEGGMEIFRIFKGDEEKFIHLFNCHNGYYGHGFNFHIVKDGISTILHQGCL